MLAAFGLKKLEISMEYCRPKLSSTSGSPMRTSTPLPLRRSKWTSFAQHEFFRFCAPSVTHAGVVFNPVTAPYAPSYVRSVEAATTSFAVELSSMPVGDVVELEGAIKTLAKTSNGAVLVMTSPRRTARSFLHWSKYRLPALYPYRFFATSGGFVSYGVDTVDRSKPG
jgi:putative ABC transport system substrate-binding protein